LVLLESGDKKERENMLVVVQERREEDEKNGWGSCFFLFSLFIFCFVLFFLSLYILF
jgi:cell division septal protein FtsQ